METKKISKDSKKYPALLKEIYDPPKTLYYKGILPQEGKIRLAVVGTRKMSPYGKLVLSRLLPPLIKRGVEIISGLAIGVDGEAHKITIENDGITHAVIGGGLDKEMLYPKSNLILASDIIKVGGSVLSEHKDKTPPLPKYFAMRNRIIAGLANGTLVIEAPKKSGALITAESALNASREVFAVPGNIDTLTSYGTNNLIKIGAHLVTNAEDIISILGIKDLNHDEENKKEINDPLVLLLSEKPLHIDDLAKELNLTAKEVSARLSKLELNGVVQNIGNMKYSVK